MGRTFHSCSKILAYSALNSEKITIFGLVTAQHENEAQSGNYSLRVYFKLFIRKKRLILLPIMILDQALLKLYKQRLLD